jgi:hypothetical protein
VSGVADPCVAAPCVAAPWGAGAGGAEQPATIAAAAHAVTMRQGFITTASFVIKGRGNDVTGWT